MIIKKHALKFLFSRVILFTKMTSKIHVFVCILGVFGAVFGEIEPNNALDDLLRYIINEFKDVIVNGSECYGIPPLDPLVVPNTTIHISQPLLKANGGIGNAVAEGLRTLEATSVSSNLVQLTMALQMELQDIVAQGEYDVDGLAALIFPVYGKGPFHVKIGGINIGGQGAIGVKNGFVYMRSIDFNFTLGELDIRLEGLLGGGDLGDVINEIINSVGLTIVEKLETFLHKTIADSLLEFINFRLDGVTLIDLIGGLIPKPGNNCTGGTTTPKNFVLLQ